MKFMRTLRSIHRAKLDDTGQLLYSKVKAIYMKIKDGTFPEGGYRQKLMSNGCRWKFSAFVLFLITRTNWPCIKGPPNVKIRASFSRFS